MLIKQNTRRKSNDKKCIHWNSRSLVHSDAVDDDDDGTSVMMLLLLVLCIALKVMHCGTLRMVTAALSMSYSITAAYKSGC